jgi:hypothetical protein
VIEFGAQQVLALFSLLVPRNIAVKPLTPIGRPVVSNAAREVSSSHTSWPSGRMKRKVTVAGASAVADVHLSAEQRRALALLIRAQRGLTKAALLRVHGFTFELLNGLVHDGLDEAATGTVMRGSRTVEVTRVRVTAAGRDALAGEG